MGRGAKQVPEGRNAFHPAVISTTSHLCQQGGQMSVVFLKGTCKQAAEKTVLIKEPACTHGLSLLGWFLQGQSLHKHIKPVQKPRVHPGVMSLACHTTGAVLESPGFSPSLTPRSPPSHLQPSSTTALLEMDVAISCGLSRVTPGPILSESGNISSCLSRHQDVAPSALSYLFAS